MDDSSDADRALAWQWFSLHSGQRLQLVNFWLVAVAFLVAAFVQAKTSHLTALSLGVATLGIIASLAFWQLDERTRRLTSVAETALQIIEDKRLASGISDQRLVQAGHLARSSWFSSYRVIIQGLQLSVAVLFALAGVYAIVAP